MVGMGGRFFRYSFTLGGGGVQLIVACGGVLSMAYICGGSVTL
jgi:hypothetical protein